jgi:phospholipid/cholesterol/gamma-HCH transport system substrate-binding protein
MTTTKQQKIRIGMFVVVAGVLTAIILAAFAGVHFWKPGTRYYITFNDSVVGLESGAEVTFNGIRVGKVADITLPPDDLTKVRVVIEVKQGTPIHVDTRAMLQYAGITGLKTIDLHGGSPSSPKLPAGGTIVTGETILDKLQSRAMAVVDQTQQILENTNEIVKTAQHVVSNVNELTDPSKLGDVVTQSRQAAANLAELSRSMRMIVEENRVSLHASVASVELAAKRIADMIDGNQVKAAVSDLRQASRSFKEMAREVRQRPSRLIFSSPQSDRKLP